MTGFPLDIGTAHFVGIGGIGMSGIAELLHQMGHAVQGSDAVEGSNVRRLQGLGIPISIGHDPENIGTCDVVVVSSAVKANNPELREARARELPVLRRAEMLAELMRYQWSISIAGTHGKTTTTAILASIMDAAGLDPTVVNGGIMNAYGTNARHGSGQWIIAEADESDGTFVHLPTTIGVVTNIDPEHLDHYGTESVLMDAFAQFAGEVPYYGAIVLSADHQGTKELQHRVTDKSVITFGYSADADIRADDVRYEDGVACFNVSVHGHELTALRLPLPGRHNILNALAAIGAASILGLEDEAIRNGLAGFAGVQRRFTNVGESHQVQIIDDYAHHPVEIAAVLAAARESYDEQIIAVVQPHRYTRLRDLFEDFCGCFSDADIILVTDVYPAGEAPIEGVDRTALAKGIAREHGGLVLETSGEADLAKLVLSHSSPGDVVVCLGAGNITDWAKSLPSALERGHAGLATGEAK